MRLHRAARRGADEQGQSTVELALLLPVVVVLLLAVLQVGLVGRDLLLVTHAAREAARAAATDPDPAAARRAAASATGLPADGLTVTASRRGAPGTRLRVTVSYRAPTAVPLVGALLGERTLRASATMRVEGPEP